MGGDEDSGSRPVPGDPPPTRITYREWLAGMAMQAWIEVLSPRYEGVKITHGDQVAARDAALLAAYSADRLIAEIDKEDAHGNEG